MAAHGEPSATGISGAGAVLRLIRHGAATTRSDLVTTTGLARSTISQRVDALISRRLLVSDADVTATGGRPAQVLSFNHSAGVVLAADLGATHARLALCDLAGDILAEEAHDIAIADGPEAVMEWLEGRFDALLAAAPERSGGEASGRDMGAARCWGSGSGCPARSSIRPGSRSRRRSCPAGTAIRSRRGSRTGTARRRSSTTTRT